MWLSNAALSALANVILLAAVPFLLYVAYHRIRWKRSVGEAARRAGLQLGDTRYVVYSFGIATLSVGALLIWPPDLDAMTREGSAQRQFAGLGFGGRAVVEALIYGLVKTGFAEEFLFRGLIAGSLARRLVLFWANVIQALIFLAPHLALLAVMPEMWPILIVVFAGAIVTGWIRIKSGSIAGPWLIHGMVNVATSLSVASRSGL